jgi:hypothetical protein
LGGRQNEYEYFCHREYHLEQTKFCYLIPHFESHFSNLSFPPGLGYFGTAPIEISPDLLKSILSVYTSFVQRYITSVNELGKLLLSFLPAFFMLVTLPVLQQNFTAGSGGARALVSAVT